MLRRRAERRPGVPAVLLKIVLTRRIDDDGLIENAGGIIDVLAQIIAARLDPAVVSFPGEVHS